MFRKIALASLLGTFVIFAGLGAANNAQAADSCTPTVKVQETKETSVKLKVTCASLKNTKVSVKILVSNEDTDSDSNKTASATLGKNGSVSLKISGLDSSTKYSFKVKVKKSSDSSYSSYSSSTSATTKGSDYEPKIEKINGLTEDSAKIKISCDDLEDKSVNVQVAYKKKSSWSTKTFDLTLDSDAEVAVTVDGLKSGTEYSFKVRIKEKGDSNYSAYSSEKTATTDEN